MAEMKCDYMAEMKTVPGFNHHPARPPCLSPILIPCLFETAFKVTELHYTGYLLSNALGESAKNGLPNVFNMGVQIANTHADRIITLPN